MNCPNCWHELYCGCRACVAKNPGRSGNTIWEDNGEISKCPYCGFRASADEWLDIEWEQFRLRENQYDRWVKKMNDHEKRVYKNHIKRLQETNNVISQALVAERKCRKEAYSWYRKKLISKLWAVWGVFILNKWR